MDKELYTKELARLQVALVNLQEWIKYQDLRVVVLFEGRDAAGKGGTIKRITECLNPRVCRVIALPAPTDREKTQWYYQRYVAHLPAAGEMVLFDRSWYNRAGVEHVMGFCTEEQYQEFLRTCPLFEDMLIRAGIILIKYWFSVSDEEQERRFRQRIEDQPHGPGIPRPLGGILQGQGRDVCIYGHEAFAMVCRRGRQQAMRPAELHQPSAEPDPVWKGPTPEDQAASPAARDGLCPPTQVGVYLRAGGVCADVRQAEGG
jgi:polyphosphate kinase 2